MSKIDPVLRAKQNGHQGCVIWFTGFSAAGKSTLAQELELQLFHAGKQAFLLDGDNLRGGLCSDLGFSTSDRTENIRRAAHVAHLFANAGLICLAAFISPLRSDRDYARNLMPGGKFIEVFVDAPLAICRQRDPKGLYLRADRGEIANFTGVSSPYEPPLHPEVTLHTDRQSVEACIAHILAFLREPQRGIL